MNFSQNIFSFIYKFLRNIFKELKYFYNKFFYTSPFGILEIVIKKDRIISIKFVDKAGTSSCATSFSHLIVNQLSEYFSGKRRKFDLKIEPEGTEFQMRVWRELQNIPYGKTSSYSEIAVLIGNKNASRAVGNACNKNPILFLIPCHRVIAKNGNMSGFAYGSYVKEKLLRFENDNS